MFSKCLSSYVPFNSCKGTQWFSVLCTEYIYVFAVYSLILQSMVEFIMVYDNNGLSKHCTSWFSCPIVVYEENIGILEYCFIIFNLSWQQTETTKLMVSVMRSITMNPIVHVKFCQRSKIESHKFNFIFCPLFSRWCSK